jgi:hypothetical protein
MQLPYPVIFEPPRRVARIWSVLALIGGLAAAAVSALLLLCPPAGAEPEAGGASLRVESQPPGATVEIDGWARTQPPRGGPRAR